jgi:hydroxypyruvate reductase
MIKQSVKSAGNLKLTNSLPASHHIVASNRVAMEAIEKACKDRQQDVYLHSDFLGGEAADTGRELARFLLNEAEPGIHIWGGETTVRLPDEPGRGGRNQQLALAAAAMLKGNQKITLLAAGTDGSDGPTEDAGGIVDGDTVTRGQLSELDVETCLVGADAGTFLEAAGDLLYTGPTGTNVMDLVIAIKTG